MAQYTKFAIPSNSPGGWLKVHGVDPSWGVMLWTSPAVPTRFFDFRFEDGDTFLIRVDDVTTNMLINLQERPGVQPRIEANGITYHQVQQNLPNPIPSQ